MTPTACTARSIHLGSLLLMMGLALSGCTPGDMTPTNQNTNESPSGNDNADNDNVASNDNTAANGNSSSNDNEGPDDPMFGTRIEIPNEGATHIPVGTQAEYLTNPPASGPHWSQLIVAPVPAGVFTDRIEEEQWVHNIEHGYVVVLYSCEGDCTDLQDDLRDLFDSLPESETFGTVKFVAAPYTGLPGVLTAIAWDVQLNLEAFDADVLTDFYEDFLDQGPELAP